MGGLEVSGRNLKIVRGDSGVLHLDLYLGTDVYRLAEGDSGILTVKKRAKDEDIVLQKQMDDTASFAFLPEDTASVEPGKYVYDIQLTFGTGEVLTIAMGKFTVTRDVTTAVIV